MANRSSGSYYKDHGFNPIQIKDGWIVRMRKDGTIKQKIEKYIPKKDRVKNNG
jgi:hypothetical protein